MSAHDLPGDPGLPPGCSEQDIEAAAGSGYDCGDCEGTGRAFWSVCCGAAMRGYDLVTLVCPECLEATERGICPACEGSGTSHSP